MIIINSAIGIFMAIALSILLVNIDTARSKSELKSRQKSTFLANMSHEIRTPMNSIIGFSELALDDEAASPKTKHYLKSIADNAKWLLNIINDILDSSKIESGKISLERIPYDLQDVISQCQSAILPKASEKGISLYCYAENLPEKTLIGDPVRLRQVFMNLLSNAIKFTNTGTVKLLSSIKHINDDTATINFEIKDSGIGMSSEQIEQIFDPFMQADDSVTRKYGGTGLGLTITKNILELMGSKLNVKSALGVGSIFSFDLTFDILDDKAAAQLSGIVSSKVERPKFNGEILVCEDNHLNQQVICEHLERVGLRTVFAENGRECLDIITGRMEAAQSFAADNGEIDEFKPFDKPFDLIFMDIHMPVMDGLEASSKLTELGIKTPIIALTANIMSNDLEIYKAHGMQDYLGKPFTTQELWKCLLRYFKVESYSKISKDDQDTEDNQSFAQLQIHFAKDNQDIDKKIRVAINDSDIKLAHRLAHTLKSNAGQIREIDLRDEADILEEHLSKDNILAAKAQLEHVSLALQTVLVRLSPLLTDVYKKTVEKLTDPEEISLTLNKLELMLQKNNPECMKMIDDLNAIPGAERLVLYVEEFDFKNALVELGDLSERLQAGEYNGG